MKIEDNVLIQCPERKFNLRKAKYCFECEDYGGMAQPTINGEAIENATIDQYQIVCKRPITRKLSEIEID
jgi:hypothetical protein